MVSYVTSPAGPAILFRQMHRRTPSPSGENEMPLSYHRNKVKNIFDRRVIVL